MDDDEDEAASASPVPAPTEGDTVTPPTTSDVSEKTVDSASTSIPKPQSQTLQAQKGPQPQASSAH